MFTMAAGLTGQAKQGAWRATKMLRVAALVGTLILVSIAVNVLVVMADRNARARPSATGSCSAIMQSAERLACYDKLAGQPAPHPFKGATAPAVNTSL
jgi:hypothetical protein